MFFWLLVLIPLALVGVYALYRYAAGRPLARRATDMLLALLLLGYFLTTACLGIFWVARHELPIFDMHYLFGYATLLLVVVHVTLNWQTIVAFFRRSPSMPPGKEGMRRRRLGWMVGLVVFGLICFWLGRQQAVYKIVITMEEPSTAALPRASEVESEPTYHNQAATPADAKPALRPATVLGRQWIKSGGEERILADYFHEKTKHTHLSVMLGAGIDTSTQPSVFKAYPDAETLELPSPLDHAGVSVGAAIRGYRQPVEGFTPEPLSLVELSTLLFMTNGVTSTLHYPGIKYYLRAAPSAGALYPTVTYAVVREVEGLSPGLYHYSVKEHALHRLGGDETLTEELAALVPQRHYVENAPVTFVFTSVFYRSSWKYEERAYRYCCMDAGHLAMQTALTADALGYGSKLIGRFDDTKVNALLELDENKEACMLVMPVGKRAATSLSEAGQQEFSAAPRNLSAVHDPLVFLMHGRTYLGLTGERVALFPPRQPLEKLFYEELPQIPLSWEWNEADDLFDTIRRRRSSREWAGVPLSVAELSSILHFAFGGADQDLPLDPGVEDNQALNLYVLVNDVQDLEPGVYYYKREEHTLVQIREGDFRSRGYTAALYQEAVGNSQATLIMAVDLQRLGYPDGDRGHRYAALDAGMLGGRVYLQTIGLGLGCCGIGAYFDNDVSKLVDVSPKKELVIYMVTIGVKANPVE